MIAVGVIGLLAPMAIPAFQRVRASARHARFVSGLRSFSPAVETDPRRNGGWRPHADTGVVPTGLSGELTDGASTTAQTSLGGRWHGALTLPGPTAGCSVTQVTAPAPR